MDDRPILSQADLETYDPQGQGSRRLCPFCGDEKPRDNAHRCLNVDFQSGLWKCFRCGRYGRLREFWQPKQSCSELRALPRQRLRQAFALPPLATPIQEITQSNDEIIGEETLPPNHTLPELSDTNDRTNTDWRCHLQQWQEIVATPGSQYLEKRGVPLAIAQSAGVGFVSHWFGRSAVLFPIRDRQGELVAVQGRALRGDAKIAVGPKSQGAFFACVPRAGSAFHPLASEVPAIILTEAPIDALSIAACGFPALAVCGTSGPNWLHIACGLRRVLLAFDADSAGDKASAALQERLQPFGAQCERLRPVGAKDWNEVLQGQGVAELSDRLASYVLTA